MPQKESGTQTRNTCAGTHPCYSPCFKRPGGIDLSAFSARLATVGVHTIFAHVARGCQVPHPEHRPARHIASFTGIHDGSGEYLVFTIQCIAIEQSLVRERLSLIIISLAQNYHPGISVRRGPGRGPSSRRMAAPGYWGSKTGPTDHQIMHACVGVLSILIR
jgi:hypothetical protein